MPKEKEDDRPSRPVAIIGGSSSASLINSAPVASGGGDSFEEKADPNARGYLTINIARVTGIWIQLLF